eukprot:CAMPEP_0114996628 /NCGR_PEP_ID=MMETSP0216-20121206/14431_1 /TAXON_ID=223996 /ORGANISM="Protocruzia adherens, Strain Boccale" /LENGTH=364 /DNA_ID=CAMNT_0002360883 /DNA_START=127 /DNA_END=1221 /DNA_ORIENTATION=+
MAAPKKIYSFSPGPSTIAYGAMKKAYDEFWDCAGTGLNIMDLSHRNKNYLKIHERAKAGIKELLNVPDNYKILFMTGGATMQYALVPMNILGDKTTASFAMSGHWAIQAIKEAQKYVENPKKNSDTSDSNYNKVPTEFDIDPNSAFFHYCDNETAQGIEYQEVPNVPDHIPIVCDMCSNIMSRPVDVSKYGIIFAGAQKNLGAVGVTVVIIRDDLLDKEMKTTPTIGSYKIMADTDSLYNTVPTYSVYMTALVCEQFLADGGLKAADEKAKRRSGMLYDIIDTSEGFYSGHAEKWCRSRLNVVFKLPSAELDQKFIADAEEAGLIDIKGFPTIGGVRVSIYNGTPDEGVDAMAAFMRRFMEANK